ncbi:MFS transporter [Amnibacterium sp. CER49]|uniref:MFS transporter n=1 Tax=Amnibacterium sp. CER49 TaxID=3039161 RepID=UPI00244AB6CE|nr:MFS transporter [Amnibacterium sp. CER49]MDH2444022.1 MFS transporter [Amnibacterium sp. CER49]
MTKHLTEPSPARTGVAWGALAVFLVALCLRPSITAVGPLVPVIGHDEHVSEGLLGLLGALPLLAFAAVSPVVHRATGRIGPERTLLVALVVLTVGTAVRSLGGVPGLWIGTALLGAAIAVGNVLAPVLVRRDFPRHVSVATGAFSAFMAIAAAVASAVAVPIATATDWRVSLGIWAVLAAVVTVIWLPRARARGADDPDGLEPVEPHASVWRRREAWLVTAYMGLQSTTFYVFVTWLPSIEQSLGVALPTAGLHLFLFQIVGILGGLVIPGLLGSGRDQRLGAVAPVVAVAVAVLGLLLAPQLVLLWALFAGLGQGASLVVALTLMSLRGRSHTDTAQLSGMAQSLGYLLAAFGPIAAGAIAEAAGWPAALLLVAGVVVAHAVVAVFAGRPPRAAVPADDRA